MKLFKYKNAGVREYWIVNPMNKSTTVYDFDHNKTTGLYSFDDRIPVSTFPEFTVKISDLLK
ncbi:MAG: hypothetical protein SPG59_03645 [Blautia sp.]|nr:hypothetical protein [Blautia sp.]